MKNSHVGFRRVPDIIIISIIIILHTPYPVPEQPQCKRWCWAYLLQYRSANSLNFPVVGPSSGEKENAQTPQREFLRLTSCDGEKKKEESGRMCKKLRFSLSGFCTLYGMYSISYALPRSILCISIRFWTLSSLNRGGAGGGGVFQNKNRNDLLNAGEVDSSSSSFSFWLPGTYSTPSMPPLGLGGVSPHGLHVWWVRRRRRGKSMLYDV